MIVNSLSEISNINNSVIIIGSGPAGISTAIKLEKNRVKSIILAEELGGVFLDNDIGRIALNDYLYSENGEYDVTTGNHQLGGTRIGYDQNDSVVDKNLKVHDVENLYINGSSVFRTGGHCHPTYTIVKLSLRLADHLKNLKV